MKNNKKIWALSDIKDILQEVMKILPKLDFLTNVKKYNRSFRVILSDTPYKCSLVNVSIIDLPEFSKSLSILWEASSASRSCSPFFLVYSRSLSPKSAVIPSTQSAAFLVSSSIELKRLIWDANTQFRRKLIARKSLQDYSLKFILKNWWIIDKYFQL